VDTYSLFSNRADPGDTRPTYSEVSVLPPLFNGDSANLAVTLLGLPAIPGSSLIPSAGSAQASVVLSVSMVGDQLVIQWPADADGYELETATVMGPLADWQIITEFTTVEPGPEGDVRVFRVTPALEASVRFFRLVKP